MNTCESDISKDCKKYTLTKYNDYYISIIDSFFRERERDDVFITILLLFKTSLLKKLSRVFGRLIIDDKIRRCNNTTADIIGAIFRVSRVEVSPVDVVKSSYLECE